ncbi:MAG: F0F1 ATP synthase subunit delta [Bifidobacteriaceae bacterium]|nr:F0F1 ATP synthase subunit delta [Bifidobacteriaceae bacterium]
MVDGSGDGRQGGGVAYLGASAAGLAEAKAMARRATAAAADQALRFAGELFALVDALDQDRALARALTNPNRPAAPKKRLVRQAMAGHFQPAVDLAAAVSVLRWPGEADLANVLEEVAFEAALSPTAGDEALRQIEAELFQVDSVLRHQRDLRTALGDVLAEPEARAKLARTVFGPVVSPLTAWLLERVVTHPRGRGIRYSLIYLGGLIAVQRGRLVAAVTTARALTSDQLGRLGQALSAAYGRAIQLNVTVDPSVLGGLRIRLGDDVVDGSLLTRLADIRRGLAA